MYTSEVARMDQDVKARWLEALRSGDFSQTRGALHKASDQNDWYCCLGVLCKVQGLTETPWSERDGGFTLFQFHHGDRSSEARLPGSFADDLNLETLGDIFEATPTEDDVPYGYFLAELNDQGFTFNQIADLIEYFL